MFRLVYAVRLALWALGNLLRRLRRTPDFVVLMLSGAYPEVQQPAGSLIVRRLRRPGPSVQQFADQLRTIAEDPRISGVVLHLRQLQMPQAALESLRDLLLEFKASGKRLIAWSTSYGAPDYLIASVADEILLQPGGAIGPLGISRRYSYLAEAFDRLGMQADFLAISPYKTAGDTLTRSEMSEEARQMADWLIESEFAERTQMIQEGRGWDLEQAGTLIDATPLTDDRALEHAAVDGLLTEEQLPAYLGDGERPVRLSEWDRARRALRRRRPARPGRYVALLVIEGLIVDGESGRPPIRPPIPVPLLFDPRAGDLSVVQAARLAAADPRAAAVVLYVNSRGGSATASEAMFAALERIQAAKPLVVSMGPVAASGGYHVAAAGGSIFAQPSTITGSIGVLAGKLVTGKLYDKLSLGREILSRGAQTLIYDDEEPFTHDQRQVVHSFIQRSYDLFVETVAASRSLTATEVDAIGGGRVWTGRQAREKGLVDELGGLQSALIRARQLAGLRPDTPVRLIQPAKRWLPPVVPATAVMEYLMAGLRMFQPARMLRLLQLIEDEAFR